MGVTGRPGLDRLITGAMASRPGRWAMANPLTREALTVANRSARRVRQGARLAHPRHRAAARTNPANPTVGLAMMAQDVAHLLPAALTPALTALMDDVVVLDSGSRDDTRAVARQLGARVVDAPWPDGGFGEQQTRAAHACRADWVLILDSDETASTALIEALPGLIRTRRHTGWWLPRRWLVARGDGVGFLASNPHWPDHQARLARRDEALRYTGQVHQTLAASTPGSWGIEARAALLHFDLLLNDRATRRAKVESRAHLPGFAGTEGFYLWEDGRPHVVPLPGPDPAAREALARLGWPRSVAAAGAPPRPPEVR